MGRARDRVSSNQGQQEVQQAGLAACTAGSEIGKGRAGSRDSDTQGQQYVGPAAGQATGGRPQGEQWAGSAAARHEQGCQQAGPNINVMSCP